MTSPVVLCAPVRTPIGAYGGALKDMKAPALGSVAIAGGIRYLLVVLVAGCVWPLTFWWFSRLGRR